MDYLNVDKVNLGDIIIKVNKFLFKNMWMTNTY